MERCFSCAVEGECTELFVKKPHDYRGPYFPIFERFNPPSSTNSISPQGTVKVCKLCKIYLYSQWDSFESHGVPESRRMYFTKRHDNIAAMYNGSMSSSNSEIYQTPLNDAGSKLTNELSMNLMKQHQLSVTPTIPSLKSVCNNDDLNNVLRSNPNISTTPTSDSNNNNNNSNNNNSNSSKKLTEHHICCFVCGQPCLKCNSKTAYSLQVLENKEYFPFFEKLDPPALSINLVNGATKICIQCESDLQRQWDDYERSKTDQTARVYHITDDHSTPFSINNPGRFISNSSNYFLFWKSKNQSIKCALCLNKIIDPFTITWNPNKNNVLFIPNLINFNFPKDSIIYDKTTQESIICDICHYFLSKQYQNHETKMTPLINREYRIPKLGNLPSITGTSNNNSNNNNNNINNNSNVNYMAAFDKVSYQQQFTSSNNSPSIKKVPSLSSLHSFGGGSSSAFQPLDYNATPTTTSTVTNSNSSTTKFKTEPRIFNPPNPIFDFSTPTSTPTSTLHSYYQQQQQQLLQQKTTPSSSASSSSSTPISTNNKTNTKHLTVPCDSKSVIHGPIIANCHICLCELRDPNTLKTLRGDRSMNKPDLPFFPFLKKLRENSMKSFEFPVCMYCYYNMMGQWQMQMNSDIPIDDRQYKSTDYTCNQCRQLFAQKSEVVISNTTPKRLLCNMCIEELKKVNLNEEIRDAVMDDKELTKSISPPKLEIASSTNSQTQLSSDFHLTQSSPSSLKCGYKTTVTVPPISTTTTTSAVDVPTGNMNSTIQSNDSVSSFNKLQKNSPNNIMASNSQRSSPYNNNGSNRTSPSLFTNNELFNKFVQQHQQNLSNIQQQPSTSSSSSVASVAASSTNSNNNNNSMSLNHKTSNHQTSGIKRPVIATVAPNQRQNTPLVPPDISMLMQQHQLQQLEQLRSKQEQSKSSNPASNFFQNLTPSQQQALLSSQFNNNNNNNSNLNNNNQLLSAFAASLGFNPATQPTQQPPTTPHQNTSLNAPNNGNNFKNPFPVPNYNNTNNFFNMPSQLNSNIGHFPNSSNSFDPKLRLNPTPTPSTNNSNNNNTANSSYNPFMTWIHGNNNNSNTNSTNTKPPLQPTQNTSNFPLNDLLAAHFPQQAPNSTPGGSGVIPPTPFPPVPPPQSHPSSAAASQYSSQFFNSLREQQQQQQQQELEMLINLYYYKHYMQQQTSSSSSTSSEESAYMRYLYALYQSMMATEMSAAAGSHQQPNSFNQSQNNWLQQQQQQQQLHALSSVLGATGASQSQSSNYQMMIQALLMQQQQQPGPSNNGLVPPPPTLTPNMPSPNPTTPAANKPPNHYPDHPHSSHPHHHPHYPYHNRQQQQQQMRPSSSSTLNQSSSAAAAAAAAANQQMLSLLSAATGQTFPPNYDLTKLPPSYQELVKYFELLKTYHNQSQPTPPTPTTPYPQHTKQHSTPNSMNNNNNIYQQYQQLMAAAAAVSSASSSSSSISASYSNKQHSNHVTPTHSISHSFDPSLSSQTSASLSSSNQPKVVQATTCHLQTAYPHDKANREKSKTPNSSQQKNSTTMKSENIHTKFNSKTSHGGSDYMDQQRKSLHHHPSLITKQESMETGDCVLDLSQSTHTITTETAIKQEATQHNATPYAIDSITKINMDNSINNDKSLSINVIDSSIESIDIKYEDQSELSEESTIRQKSLLDSLNSKSLFSYLLECKKKQLKSPKTEIQLQNEDIYRNKSRLKKFPSSFKMYRFIYEIKQLYQNNSDLNNSSNKLNNKKRFCSRRKSAFLNSLGLQDVDLTYPNRKPKSPTKSIQELQDKFNRKYFTLENSESDLSFDDSSMEFENNSNNNIKIETEKEEIPITKLQIRRQRRKQYREIIKYGRYWKRTLKKQLKKRLSTAIDKSQHLRRSLMRPVLSGSGGRGCVVFRKLSGKHEAINTRNLLTILSKYI